MAKRISAATAKAQLSALLDDVAFRGAHYVIERRGRPVAALVSVDELQRIEHPQDHPPGFLSLIGTLSDVSDEEIDQLVADIYAARESDLGRPVELEE